MNLKSIGLAVGGLFAVLGVLAFLGIHLGGSAPKVGSTGNAAETYYNSQWLVGGIQVGPTGTLNANSQFGSCNLIGGSKGIAATSTATFDCAVTGVQKGDVVMGDLGVNAPFSLGSGFVVAAAQASTTAGYITYTILNLTGAASTTLGTNLTNGMEYFTLR